MALANCTDPVYFPRWEQLFSCYSDGNSAVPCAETLWSRRRAEGQAGPRNTDNGQYFADFDLEQFWKPSKYAEKEYVAAPLTDEVVAAVERELGYKLPASYVELMKFQNGGIPRKANHRIKERTSWANDHIAITGIYSIGREKPCSLCGKVGSKFWAEEWGYPEIGVYFANCPSAGHDMVCLDYRACGPTGEPQVVHIDQEWDYKMVFVAESFEAFIRGLEDDSSFN